MIEGTLFLNMSFSFSRKIRNEIDDSFNFPAATLLLISLAFVGLNGYLLAHILTASTVYENGSFLASLAVVILLEVFIVIYTVKVGSNDCIITNATCAAAYLTYCMYRFYMRSLEPECTVEMFNAANLASDFLQSKDE